MYRNDRPFASAFGDDFNSTTFHPRQWFGNSKDIAKKEKWNPMVATLDGEIDYSQESLHESNTYVHPKSTYNGYLARNSKIENDPNSLDAIMGRLDRYRNKVETPYQSQNQMDLDTKVVIPNQRCHGKKESENTYQSVPYMQGNSRDIDVDTFVRLRAGTRNSKSVGYPNPVEHYYNFISDDIQRPEHTVNMRGIPSRALNKQTARPMINRDVMP